MHLQGPDHSAKLNWLGRQDSNLGMRGSKPRALPLGDAPINCKHPSDQRQRLV